MTKARDFNHFFGQAVERSRHAGEILRKMHAERPFTNREDIPMAYNRELERLQPEVLADELVELSKQVDVLLHVADRRGYQIDGRRTAMCELAAEMIELRRATERWLVEDGQTPLAFTLALIEKYRRVLVMLAESVKLPARAGVPLEIADGATLSTTAMN